MEPIIEFENFTFKYRSQMEPTLRDINLKIYPGEKVLIIGPSGSGKSTLSNCINGLIPFSYEGDSTGTLKIEGKDPKKLGIFGLSKMVGTVLQDTDGQFIGLTVAEDIAFVLENDCMAQEEMFRKVDDVAETVEVKELLHHAPSEMSGGQKQRVSMAGVMIDDVDILLFDEPLANLDPATGKKAIALIDRIQKEQKKTIVIIEHRLEDVLYKDVDRIVVVGDGTIVADMKPDDLLVGNILEEQGIREPLYVTALKHAGCTITAQDHPQHVETMNFEPYKTQVREWFETTQIPQKQETQEKVLKVDHLHFSYQPEKAILSDISFDVKKGEMISIVGKNGAGKTTLSNLICGFLEPSKGKIELNGNDISPLSVKERGEHIGIVMQNPNQMISKPMIYEEVALGLTVRGVPEEEIRERVHETLKICGLYQFRNWPVSALSFGQKKRVTIASILVMKPEILILEEPTNDPDLQTLMILEDYLDSFQGIVITVSHDRYFLDRIAKRIFAFEGAGKIVQYEGGYTDYMNKRPQPASGKIVSEEAVSEEARKKKSMETWGHEKKLKFTYKEQKEYETIEADIEKLETRLSEIDDEMVKNATNFGKLNELTKEKEDLEGQLMEKMDRWEYLEDLAQKIANLT